MAMNLGLYKLSFCHFFWRLKVDKGLLLGVTAAGKDLTAFVFECDGCVGEILANWSYQSTVFYRFLRCIAYIYRILLPTTSVVSASPPMAMFGRNLLPRSSGQPHLLNSNTRLETINIDTKSASKMRFPVPVRSVETPVVYSPRDATASDPAKSTI
jgi:hypothetical protein